MNLLLLPGLYYVILADQRGAIMMIKEMRSEDKPRERFAKAPDTASMVDLVAILLRTGRHGCSVMDMAQEVVEQIRLSTDVNGFDKFGLAGFNLCEGCWTR